MKFTKKTPTLSFLVIIAALPAIGYWLLSCGYSDCTARAKFSEVLLHIMPVKHTLSTACANNAWTTETTEPDVNAQQYSSGIYTDITSIDIQDNNFAVINMKVHRDITTDWRFGKSVAIPSGTTYQFGLRCENGKITKTCSSGIDLQYLPKTLKALCDSNSN